MVGLFTIQEVVPIIVAFSLAILHSNAFDESASLLMLVLKVPTYEDFVSFRVVWNDLIEFRVEPQDFLGVYEWDECCVLFI